MLALVSMALDNLTAATLRREVATGNIANAQDNGALPGYPGPAPYTAMQVVLPDTGSDAVAYAVLVNPTDTTAFDPSSPDGNAQGLAPGQSLDPTRDIVQSEIAQQSFEANLDTVQTAFSMTNRLLGIA
jgi:flagellar basal-body rod protein FlgC